MRYRIFATAACWIAVFATVALGQQKFTPPSSARMTYNFNPGWRFIKQEVPGCETPDFDDSKWDAVSTPHTYNDIDSFDEYITRGGEVSIYTGPAQYRKHFKLPASATGSKIILEFEGMRQAAKFWVNGKLVGKYENGVTPCGIDITDAINFDGKENVLAVWITNVQNYAEESSGTAYQWESRDFNPNYGGINQNVWLHVVPKVYQTLPLLDGLNTTGTYVYPTNFNLAGSKTATLNVESQIRNESGQPAPGMTYTAVVVDDAGAVHGRFEVGWDHLGTGDSMMKLSGLIQNIRFWSPDDPVLYDVYGILTVGGKVVDVNKITTGFRKAEFKGGAGTGGVYINDKFTYLKGYAIRSINEWAAVGGAYPDWMNDFDADLLHSGNGNYVRWMHIAPKPKDSRACDRFGIVQLCPAGDKEGNPTNPAQWNQRVDVMRKTMIYYRNSPSILFWEAGNSPVGPERLQQMVDIRKELDPHGMRVVGDRGNDNNAISTASTPVGEFFGVMIGQDRQTENLSKPDDMFRAFSYARRDRGPIVETEDFRDEAARRFWDAYSPPNFELKRGPNDDPANFHPSSEDFCLAAARRYDAYWSNRISNTDPQHAHWSAYASIIWADSNQHGRMGSSAVSRVSGKVDSVRIPKQAYFVYRVMQNEKPDIHMIGHWNYPAGTKKTIYVAANHVNAVELQVNGKTIGKSSESQNGFIYAIPDVEFQPGSVKVLGYAGGNVVAQQEIKTVGEAKSIRLTPHTGPDGLQADGSDVAFFDVEVVDADGNRCPLDQARIDFELTGPAIWRGGVNIGIPKSTNNTYLETECGVNRVFIRSTLTAGTLKLTAKRDGLAPATVTLESKAVKLQDGLAMSLPQTYGPASPPSTRNP